jgi:hypothetical protein
VNNLLSQKEELYRRAEQFLECCWASESSSAEVHEFYNELAASKGVCVDVVRHQLSKFHTKVCKLQRLLCDLKQSTAQLRGVLPSELEVESRGSVIIELMKEPDTSKALEHFLRYNTKFNKLVAEIVEEFWDYLLPDAKKALEEFAYSTLEDRSRVLGSWGKLPGVIKVHSRYSCRTPEQKIVSHVAKCDSAILRLVNAVLGAIGQRDPDEGLYNPEIMKRFLDLLTEDALRERSKLVPYTKEMSDKARSLISGVDIEE